MKDSATATFNCDAGRRTRRGNCTLAVSGGGWGESGGGDLNVHAEQSRAQPRAHAGAKAREALARHVCRLGVVLVLTLIVHTHRCPVPYCRTVVVRLWARRVRAYGAAWVRHVGLQRHVHGG